MPIIPDDMMTRLQQANEHFRQARLRMDEINWQDKQERSQVGTALRAAQQELDDVTREIHNFLSPNAPTPAPDTPPTHQQAAQ